jgi:hypothetical protein
MAETAERQSQSREGDKEMKNTSKGRKIIHVSARKWFDKVNGNTYHSVAVTLPDGTVRTVGQTYGYGTQYEETAIRLVTPDGSYPKHPNGNPKPAWKWYEENGYQVIYDVVLVPRKKDLHEADKCDTEGARANCAYCNEPITDAGDGVWVDKSDGDCCSGDYACNNENKPHTPRRGQQCD